MKMIIKNRPLRGSVEAISSKSYAHRAIFAAALGRKPSIIYLSDLSLDIERSLEAIKEMGASVSIQGKRYLVDPIKDSKKDDIDIDVGESGTTLRFILPIMAALGINGRVIRQGSLIDRPNGPYFDIFPNLGIELTEKGDSLYLSGQLRPGEFYLPGNISSQFISGFMLASAFFDKPSKIILTTDLESRPYVEMTMEIIEKFGARILDKGSYFQVEGPLKGATYTVEGDWSNALFFLGAGVEVTGLNPLSKQGDRKALEFLADLGYQNVSSQGILLEKKHEAKNYRILDGKDMPDAVPILSLLAGKEKGYTQVINIDRLRIKESDRVASTLHVLRQLGLEVDLDQNGFGFNGGEIYQSCQIDSHNDHRIAMSAAIGALYSKDYVEVINPMVVKKSYENFYQDFEKLGGEIYVK